MEDGGRGFFKLHEDGGSSRGSVFHTTAPPEAYGLGGGTRINLGFGRCWKLHVKAEKEDGSLRIGGLALASNCNHIVLIFGFFFLLAGAVLTSLAYKPKRDSEARDSSGGTAGGEGRIAGPLFVVFGSSLIILGIGLTLVGWKVNQAVKRQLHHLSLQTPPPPTPDTPDYYNTYTDSSFLQRGGRRESMMLSPSFFTDRRTTLPTITQAVPVGFFVDGKLTSRMGAGRGGGDSGNNAVTELSPETSGPEAGESKTSLSVLLPIPILASPSFIGRGRMIAPWDATCLRTRSDEPYGSIVSLSGNGDIACFPSAPPTPFAPCQEEELASSSGETEQEGSAETQIVRPKISRDMEEIPLGPDLNAQEGPSCTST